MTNATTAKYHHIDKIRAIALTTYRESIRSKVLYSIMFFAVILIAISTFFGTVTIGDQSQVIKDFGLFSVSIFSTAFVLISGSSHLSKELSKKTIYNILARAVYRWHFLLGKYLGLLATTAVMVVLMGGALAIYLSLFEGHVNIALLESLVFIFLELIIVCAVVIFFSAIVITPLLSGLFTLGVFLAGRSTEYFMYFVNHGDITGFGASILYFLRCALPNLDKLNAVNSDQPFLDLEYFGWSMLYSIGYAAMLLVVANFVFRRREFN